MYPQYPLACWGVVLGRGPEKLIVARSPNRWGTADHRNEVRLFVFPILHFLWNSIVLVYLLLRFSWLTKLINGSHTHSLSCTRCWPFVNGCSGEVIWENGVWRRWCCCHADPRGKSFVTNRFYFPIVSPLQVLFLPSQPLYEYGRSSSGEGTPITWIASLGEREERKDSHKSQQLE